MDYWDGTEMRRTGLIFLAGIAILVMCQYCLGNSLDTYEDPAQAARKIFLSISIGIIIAGVIGGGIVYLIIRRNYAKREVSFLKEEEKLITQMKDMQVTAMDVPQMTGGVDVGRSKDKKGKEDRCKKESSHFCFINNNNLKYLKDIIRNEPLEIIALVVSCLNPSNAAQLVFSLDPEMQRGVAEHIVKGKKAEGIEKIERYIKRKLESIIKGENLAKYMLDKIDNLIGMVDNIEAHLATKNMIHSKSK